MTFPGGIGSTFLRMAGAPMKGKPIGVAVSRCIAGHGDVVYIYSD